MKRVQARCFYVPGTVGADIVHHEVLQLGEAHRAAFLYVCFRDDLQAPGSPALSFLTPAPPFKQGESGFDILYYLHLCPVIIMLCN